MATSQEIDTLFKRYLEVCNEAMEKHGSDFPYKQIWQALESLKAGQPVDLTIYDDEPQSHYKVCLKDQHIDLVADAEDDRAEGWKMNTSYLRRVVANPDEYIEQPARLDWDWLKDRAGF